MSPACAHPTPAVVHNNAGQPVRLICGCGQEWRVLPIEWAIQRVGDRCTIQPGAHQHSESCRVPIADPASEVAA